ncbi:hypothetical protein GCM10010390_08100 [Streptomyces mordarskii]|uniref:Uncharacterized protein n=1 Tax=Streptomyces mordarskii TaxID=1226758 RepID=A0ABP3LVA7_9ACTN
MLGRVAAEDRGDRTASVPAAASIIAALPVVASYVFLQRHFISGMLSGAVKG